MALMLTVSLFANTIIMCCLSSDLGVGLEFQSLIPISRLGSLYCCLYRLVKIPAPTLVLDHSIAHPVTLQSIHI